MLIRLLQVLVPIFTAIAFSSPPLSRWSSHYVRTTAPSNWLHRNCRFASTSLATTLAAFTLTTRSVLADGTYSNVNQEALRRRREKQRQEQQQQQQQKQQQQKQRHRQQQQSRERMYQQQYFSPFSDGGGSGFHHVFEQLFGGGGPGGAGGFQFTFNGHGMPFGTGGMPFGHGFHPPANDDDSANPQFIRKALKAFDLTDSFNMSELKKVYHRLALKYHPDKCGKDPQCEEKMVKVNRYKAALEKWLKRRNS